MNEATFFQTWLFGYWSPSLFAINLAGKPAPHWGLLAQSLRAVSDALLLYLPLALMGWQPSTPSYLTFINTERYYATLIWLAPIFLLCQWFLLSAIVHTILCVGGRLSDIDQILNITGMVALVVGSFLVFWDWLWVLAGWNNPYLLGISHLLIDIWGIVLTVTGFEYILRIPVWMGISLNLLWLALGLPLAILIMRAPF